MCVCIISVNDGAIKKTFSVCSRLDWVRQYMLDEDKVDVCVDFDHFRHLTYLVIIEILRKYVHDIMFI